MENYKKKSIKKSPDPDFTTEFYQILKEYQFCTNSSKKQMRKEHILTHSITLVLLILKSDTDITRKKIQDQYPS